MKPPKGSTNLTLPSFCLAGSRPMITLLFGPWWSPKQNWPACGQEAKEAFHSLLWRHVSVASLLPTGFHILHFPPPSSGTCWGLAWTSGPTAYRFHIPEVLPWQPAFNKPWRTHIQTTAPSAAPFIAIIYPVLTVSQAHQHRTQTLLVQYQGDSQTLTREQTEGPSSQGKYRQKNSTYPCNIKH